MSKERNRDRRVKVWNGDKSKYLGTGDYIGNTETYVVIVPNRPMALLSCKDPRELPNLEDYPPGSKIRKCADNPVIKLDSGGLVFGCQTWWSYVPELVEEFELDVSRLEEMAKRSAERFA